MAVFCRPPTPEILAAREKWISERPPVIQAMIAAYPPDRLYRMASGHRCIIVAYSENNTVRVEVNGEYNLVQFSREVFGVDPATLVECDLPGPDEVVGDLCEIGGIDPMVVVAGIRARRQAEGTL